MCPFLVARSSIPSVARSPISRRSIVHFSCRSIVHFWLLDRPRHQCSIQGVCVHFSSLVHAINAVYASISCRSIVHFSRRSIAHCRSIVHLSRRSISPFVSSLDSPFQVARSSTPSMHKWPPRSHLPYVIPPTYMPYWNPILGSPHNVLHFPTSKTRGKRFLKKLHFKLGLDL